MGAASIWHNFLHKAELLQQYVNAGNSVDLEFANSSYGGEGWRSGMTSLCCRRLSLAFRNSGSRVLARSVSGTLSSLQEWW